MTLTHTFFLTKIVIWNYDLNKHLFFCPVQFSEWGDLGEASLKMEIFHTPHPIWKKKEIYYFKQSFITGYHKIALSSCIDLKNINSYKKEQ